MKQYLFFISLFILSACGFTPMYADTANSAQTRLDQVKVGVIPNAEGVALRNLLIDRFYQSGYPADPRYVLSVAPIIETESDLDLTIESEATRRQLRLTTTMTLIDTANGETVLSRNLSAYSSYNIIGSQFTTRVGENDSREAAIADLARQIETQLSLYFNR